jgi:hypothetical protein
VDAKGVTMCLGEEGIWGTDKAWLQIVDLGDGARIRSIADPAPRSIYRQLFEEPEAEFRKRTAEDWYDWLRSLSTEEEWVQSTALRQYYVRPDSSRLFSVTNAAFFTDNDNANDTRLSFPFMSNPTWNGALGQSYGYAWREAHERCCTEAGNTPNIYGYDAEAPIGYNPGPCKKNRRLPAPKKILQFGYAQRVERVWDEERHVFNDVWTEENPQRASIHSFPTEYEFRRDGELYNRLRFDEREWVFDSVVSFTPKPEFGGENRRNYVGTYGDAVYILVTDEAYTNAQASEMMQEIQPGMNVIQMDGGGSAQFYSNYGEMDSSIPDTPPIFEDREVPTVLAVYRAP